MKEKISNLRCLGGYVNKDGKKVKNNLLYRSGNLNIGNEKLKDVLNSLKIKTVYDLRSNAEIQKEPYTIPNDVTYKHYPVLGSLDGFLKDLNFDLSSSKQAFNLLNNNSFMEDINKEMALNPTMFGEIIKDIIKLNGKPILFHCSAGKDRTGILSALLLLCLDVSYEEIMKDYLLSNDYLKDNIELKFDKFKNMNLREEDINKVKDMLIVKEEYLNGFLNIVKEYDSFEIYAKEKLNLNNNDLKSLKELFLEWCYNINVNLMHSFVVILVRFLFKT